MHLGRLLGPEGFSRTVAIKQLHPQFALDPEFIAMFLDEARVASRIHHPNVVSPVDVVMEGSDLFIVMDYVHGESLAHLRKLTPAPAIPARIAAGIISQALLGLHAAHEARDESGQPLGIVHRDVSPQNIMVTDHGLVRVVDFGIAKAQNQRQHTEVGKLKGKLGYMSPEQVLVGPIDRRADVFAAGIVLWEMLTGQRLFAAESPAGTVQQILKSRLTPPSELNPALTPEIDELVATALERDPERRFETAHGMAVALARVIDPANAIEIGTWVAEIAASGLHDRASRVAELEALSSKDMTRALPIADFGGAVADEGEPAEASRLSIGPTELSATSAVPIYARKGHWPWAALALGTLLLTGSVWSLIGRAGSARPTGGAPAVPELHRVSDSLVDSAPMGDLRSGVPSVVPATTGDTTPRPTGTNLGSAPSPEVITAPKRKAAEKPGLPAVPGVWKPAKPRNDCVVPYQLDGHGVKRFKEECF